VANYLEDKTFRISNKKVILDIRGRLCETPEELLRSKLFEAVINKAIEELMRKSSPLLAIFDGNPINYKSIANLTETLVYLCKVPIQLLHGKISESQAFVQIPENLNDFVEYLYNFWRTYDRFIILNSEGDMLDKRPYRSFNESIENLTHLVRKTYREIQKNISGSNPRVYRQVAAGAEVAAIALPLNIPLPEGVYSKLKDVPVIRQILLNPPLILNPPRNKRGGKFDKVARNPLEIIQLNKDEFICYPAKVGPLIILIYFHHNFLDLGMACCNLFEIAEDEDLTRTPDAAFVYGCNEELTSLSKYNTVFFEDHVNHFFMGACPNSDEYGYFGYLKKMVLTLHNAYMIKADKMPFHGALVTVSLSDIKKTILFIGDTGAGKSESLEAFRIIGKEELKDMTIIADDMGSLDINENGDILGYGTEIGAFLRLDDLQDGYALGQIDRAIIMSPSQVNARIILPVTTLKNLLKGTKVDYIFYANNYELVDEDHPIISRFDDPDSAFRTFEAGAVMSKGTTTSTGIVHSYFANVFGPPSYKEEHDKIATRYFKAFFDAGIFVGQFRTRLGIQGFERTGPEEAARALLATIKEK
jgi:hypothetical protein